MKTIPAGLATHYEGSALTLAWLWKVTRVDGGVYAFTSHNEAITFDAVTYTPSSAFDASAVATLGEFNVDDLEVVGLLDTSGVTAEDIERGLWDGASIEIRRVNWANIANGAEIVRVGEVGKIERKGQTFLVEMRGLMQALQRNIGRIVTPLCNAELGDARCGKNITSFTHAVTVSAVDVDSPRRVFTISSAQADLYFADGKATFTSGSNSGVVADIKTNDGAEITLYLPVPYDVEVGDGLTVIAGCDKRHILNADGSMTGDCHNKFANVINFRGFPAVPGRDAQLLVGGRG